MARSVMHTTAQGADSGVVEYHVVETRDDKQKIPGYGIVRSRVVKGQDEYVTVFRVPAGNAPAVALGEATRRAKLLAAITFDTAKAIIAAKERLDAAKKAKEQTGNAESPANTSSEAVPI